MGTLVAWVLVRDQFPGRAAQLVVFLASGRGDALTGRFLGPTDDAEALARRAGEIQE